MDYVDRIKTMDKLAEVEGKLGYEFDKEQYNMMAGILDEEVKAGKERD